MQPQAPKPKSHRTAIIATILVLAGIAVVLYPQLTDLRYAVAQGQMASAAAGMQDATTDGGGSTDVGSTGIPLPEGVVARLEIPAIGLAAFVVEGTDRASLAKGPGHYPSTVLPGEAGNAAIAGHRTMYGHVFRHLDQLAPGDVIRTATSQTTASYRVVQVTAVDPQDVQVIAPTSDDRLTLTTCNPVGSAAQRLVVVAEREH